MARKFEAAPDRETVRREDDSEALFDDVVLRSLVLWPRTTTAKGERDERADRGGLGRRTGHQEDGPSRTKGED